MPESQYAYYTTSTTYSRQGLRIFDARIRWQPNFVWAPGAFADGEAAIETNANFPMFACAYYGELGYAFSQLPWAPTVSHRYAQFSGDNPNDSRFGRWDPLYSGGTGEQWVQGLNDFKLFQDSNLVTNLLQLRLRPSTQVEIVPQFWLFRAASLTNLGGNPGLSFLDSHEIGSEANVTAKYFLSRNILLQGDVAVTFPGAAISQALGEKPGPWLSTMAFIRVAF